MKKFEKWEIVLVKYPFTNLEKVKLRPALVLQQYKDDVIVFPITTKKTWYFLEIQESDLVEGNLLTKSYVKVSSVFTLDSKLILVAIAKLSESKYNEIMWEFVTSILKFNIK